MSKRERPLFLRIQTILVSMSDLRPSNPCDIKGKAAASDGATEAASQLSRAIFCIGFGDYDDAAERLRRAEAAVAAARKIRAEPDRVRPAMAGEGRS